MDVTGLILAGGKSSRFGKNKAVEIINGETLLYRVVKRITSITPKIKVVTASPDYSLPELLGIEVVYDIYQGAGPLGAIHAGLNASETEMNIVVACDMPFLKTDLLRYMIDIAKGYDAVVPRLRNNMIEPLHAIYNKSCISTMKNILDKNEFRIYQAIEKLNVRYLEEKELLDYDYDLISFFNINHPSDAEVALKLAQKEMEE